MIRQRRVQQRNRLLLVSALFITLFYFFHLPSTDTNTLSNRPPPVSCSSISRIEVDYPSKETILSILKIEQDMLAIANKNKTMLHASQDDNKHNISLRASLYELVYAFVAAFQRGEITIVLGYGSHLGARRHHGIIVSTQIRMFCNYMLRTHHLDIMALIYCTYSN